MSSTSGSDLCRRTDEFKMDKELGAALRSMVEEFGFESVSRTLHEMEPDQVEMKTRAVARPKRMRNSGSRNKRSVSAVDYVRGMDIPTDRAKVIARAAEEFERRTFLPTVGDVRSFCEAYGIEQPKSRARASSIPRIFKFLLTVDAAEVNSILDDRMFSGPTELGPIADAIRGRAKEIRLGIQDPQSSAAVLLQGTEQVPNTHGSSDVPAS